MNGKIGKISVLAMAAISLISGNVSAGAGARNISTQSLQAYLSGGGRYAETEDADTVLNNPAGAGYMDDGLHLHFSTMIAHNIVDIKNLDTGKVYELEALGYIPNFAAAYKKNKWAGFITISFPGGNGGGSYDNFPAFDYAAEQASSMVGQNVTAENQEFEFAGGKGALSIGSAYRINEMFSVGYAVRAVYAMNYVDGKTTFVNQETGQVLGGLRLNQEYTGQGIGHSFCMLFNYDKFKFGLRIDPEVSVKIKADVKPDDNSGPVNGTEKHDDLPPVLFSGASYQLTPSFKFGGGFVYYWQKGVNGSDEPITEKWDNAWEVQGFAEYALSPEWELLGGANFSTPGLPNEAYTLATTSFADAWTFNFGTQWRPIPHWSFMLGMGYSYYPDDPKTEAEPMGRYERSVGKPVVQYLVGLECKM